MSHAGAAALANAYRMRGSEKKQRNNLQKAPDDSHSEAEESYSGICTAAHSKTTCLSL